jgi:ABC-2 type transport system ATP-binding protein
LEFIARLKEVPAKLQAIKIEQLSEQTGITNVLSKPIGRLSKGYRQRVGLTQALIGDPEILILDEPTVGLDPAQIKDIRRLIKSLGKQKTIILSTHILPEVEMVCDRVLIINNGQIIAQNSQEKLATSLQPHLSLEVKIRGEAQAVQASLARFPEMQNCRLLASNQGLTTLQLNINTSSHAAAVARFIIENGWELYELKPLQTSLEDIFVSLVTKENTLINSKERL